MSNEQEQDEPIQEGSGDASQDDKVTGILSQVSADLELRPKEDGFALLTTRLSDAGIRLDRDQILALADRLPRAR
ncbi:MAG: hypothetical protein QOI70_1157 [Microbacteriaceae bacterium]|jgi:hypothetical protein|nr:hypothetical protein [Microbacteriaceae bacterium]